MGVVIMVIMFLLYCYRVGRREGYFIYLVYVFSDQEKTNYCEALTLRFIL